MRVRLAACRTLLEKLRLDAVLVSDEADIRYLSGFRGEDALLVIASTEASLCTDARFWGQAAEEAPDFTLVRAQKGLFASAVAALHGSLGQGVRLGFQGASLSYERYRALRRLHDGPLRNVGQRIAHLRIIKDDREIATMRRAAAVTDCALAEVVGSGLIGRSERDVAWGLAAAFHRLGAEGEAFPAIVAAGEHGAQAHAIPGDRIIRPGDLVVIDTGARVDGYCSDTTRTYAAGSLRRRRAAFTTSFCERSWPVSRPSSPVPTAGMTSMPPADRLSRRRGTATTSATAPGTGWGCVCTRSRRWGVPSAIGWRPAWSVRSSPGSTSTGFVVSALRTQCSSPPRDVSP